MVLLRNGISSSGQLAVTDITSFTIPDTDFNAQITNQGAGVNGTNVFAPYGGMSIGSSNKETDNGGAGDTNVGALATNTGLNSELTANGLGRRHGANTQPAGTISDGVYTWLSQVAGAGSRVKWQSNWSAAWEYTGGSEQDVGEVGVVNHASANTGLTLTRQVFTTPWNLQTNDVLRLTVTVEHDGSFVAGGGGVKGGVLTNDGLWELARLLMDTATDRIGYESDPPHTIVSGDWIDENESAAARGNPLKFDQQALGDSTAARSEGMSALINEISANGSARKSGANITGEIMADPELFSGADANLFNNFAGDTVQWRPDDGTATGHYWEATGAGFSVGETGVFNGDATYDVMLMSNVFAAALPADKAGDRFSMVYRLLSQ